MSVVLSVRDFSLSKRLPTRELALLQGCALEVGAAEIVAVVGESGSGKSLLANCCLGMPPAACDWSGSIRLNGQELVGAKDADLRAMRGRDAAMIFQNPMLALNPYYRIGEQMAAVYRQRLSADRQQKDESVPIESALAEVQLPEPAQLMQRYPHQLSGGQLQRVMIAMALLCDPKLLIADEPTTALDVTVQATVLKLIRQLVNERGLSVMLISHDLAVVSQLADRVAVLYAGRIVECGPVKQVIAKPQHPYTAALLSCIPRLNESEVSPAPTVIPGNVPEPAARPSGCAFHPRCERIQAACSASMPPLTSAAMVVSEPLESSQRQWACFNPLPLS